MRVFATAGLALGLSACATLPGGANPSSSLEVLKVLSEHASQCARHYQGGLGVGASFTFNIDCPTQPQAAPPPSTSDISR